MAKIRSPRARAKGTASAPAGAGSTPGTARKSSSELMLWYHANKQWLPLVATVFGGAAIYLLSQVETLRPYMGFIGGLVLIVGGVVYGLMRPEDAPIRVGRNKFLPLAVLVAGLSLIGALLPYLHVNFPGEPHFHGTLSPEHPSRQFEVTSDKGLVEIVVHGALRKGSGSASGGYELILEHDGHKRRVKGAFRRTYSTRRIRRGRVRIGTSNEFAYHVSRVPSLGRGHYKLTLDSVDPSLRNYLRVKVYDTWYNEKILIYMLVGLGILGFFVDLASTRVKHRTRVATGAIVAIGFTIYFNRQFAPDAVMSTVLGGALVSILAGWIGGGMVSFLTKRVGGEPRPVRVAAKDDDD